MSSDLLYRDILTLIFGNESNSAYFRKYYNNNEHYQIMLRDYLNMKFFTEIEASKNRIRKNDIQKY